MAFNFRRGLLAAATAKAQDLALTEEEERFQRREAARNAALNARLDKQEGFTAAREAKRETKADKRHDEEVDLRQQALESDREYRTLVETGRQTKQEADIAEREKAQEFRELQIKWRKEDSDKKATSEDAKARNKARLSLIKDAISHAAERVENRSPPEGVSIDDWEDSLKWEYVRENAGAYNVEGVPPNKRDTSPPPPKEEFRGLLQNRRRSSGTPEPPPKDAPVDAKQAPADSYGDTPVSEAVTDGLKALGTSLARFAEVDIDLIVQHLKSQKPTGWLAMVKNLEAEKRQADDA